MGGEHICTGCNALHGMPHAVDCPRVTRERLLNARPEMFYGAERGAAGVAEVGYRLKVTDEDCLHDPMANLKDMHAPPYAGQDSDIGQPQPPEVGAEKIAQSELHGALYQEPRSEARAGLALASIAASQLALVQEVRALREELAEWRELKPEMRWMGEGG